MIFTIYQLVALVIVLQILPKILFARCGNLSKKTLNKYGLVDELNGDGARPCQTAKAGLTRHQQALVREKSKYISFLRY